MSIGKKITLGFASSLTILAAIGAIDYRCTQLLTRSTEQARHAGQILEVIDSLASQLAETPCREELRLRDPARDPRGVPAGPGRGSSRPWPGSATRSPTIWPSSPGSSADAVLVGPGTKRPGGLAGLRAKTGL